MKCPLSFVGHYNSLAPRFANKILGIEHPWKNWLREGIARQVAHFVNIFLNCCPPLFGKEKFSL
jgi:hypothetical protein